MAYTLTKLQDDLEGMLHGASLNKVQNLPALINRAARELLNDVDPSETKRTTQITNALHDRVYDYSAPSDLKSKKVIDIRPQINRAVGDSLNQNRSKEFDQYKRASRDNFTVENNSGTKYIRINTSTRPATTINDANSVTGNGTWAVGDDATNLTTDNLYYVTGGGSLNFDVTGSGTTAYLENSTMTAVDLSEHEDISSLFTWFYIPDGTTITNCTLRWGSSSANYWSVTVTAPNFGSFVTGWNLLRFDWNGATETGTPDASAVDYLRFTTTYDSDAATNLRLDNIMSSLGTIWEINYYSKFLFRTSGGTWIEEYTDDSDIINLDTDSYNLLTFKCAQYIAQQMQGEDSSFDYTVFEKQYQAAKKAYLALNKSEVLKPQTTYYRM